MSDQALARPVDGGAVVAVVQGQLTLAGEERRPPAGPAASSTISPAMRERVEPTTRRCRARRSRPSWTGPRCSGRDAGTSRRTGRRGAGVVGEHLGVDVGRGGGGGWRGGRGDVSTAAARVADSVAAGVGVAAGVAVGWRGSPLAWGSLPRIAAERERPAGRARARSAPRAAGIEGSRCRRPCPRSPGRVALEVIRAAARMSHPRAQAVVNVWRGTASSAASQVQCKYSRAGVASDAPSVAKRPLPLPTLRPDGNESRRHLASVREGRVQGSTDPMMKGRPLATVLAFGAIRRPTVIASTAIRRPTACSRVAGRPRASSRAAGTSPSGAMSTNVAGSKISARSSIPSITRGPGRLK